MSHIPINHPLRSFYRVLAVLAGIYVLVFGIVAFARTKGTALFGQDDLVWALGLRSNLGFALLSIVAGAIIIVAAVIGRNIDRFVFIWGGIAFMAIGMLSLILIRTDANFLGFSLVNCIVSMLIGAVLYSAGLYSRTGTDEEAEAEELVRHSH
jgi:hypothetical protein